MRYAILSDIHGNLEALCAVLHDIESRGIDVVVCLGDIVGYYADPEECVDLVREYTAYSVAGNHDYAAIGKIDSGRFTLHAQAAMDWTKGVLSTTSKEYLASLPLTIKIDGMFLTHASPASPDRFPYVFADSHDAILRAFDTMVRPVTFIGHSHCPFIMVQDDDVIIHRLSDDAVVDDDRYYLVNVGSVGQPRNLDTRAAYATYDTGTAELSLVRVEYDFRSTQKKIIKNRLPSFLAERLEAGK